MVMTPELKKVSTHHWLKHKPERVFHAYLSMRPGSNSVCGLSNPIADWQEMDIPGSLSPTCTSCMTELFGFKLHEASTKDRP